MAQAHLMDGTLRFPLYHGGMRYVKVIHGVKTAGTCEHRGQKQALTTPPQPAPFRHTRDYQKVSRRVWYIYTSPLSKYPLICGNESYPEGFPRKCLILVDRFRKEGETAFAGLDRSSQPRFLR
jgi:hypothetical protein